MEYCGAGSVSDIMKIRNKTVSAVKYLGSLFSQDYENIAKIQQNHL